MINIYTQRYVNPRITLRDNNYSLLSTRRKDSNKKNTFFC